jgi:hypothetical protein
MVQRWGGGIHMHRERVGEERGSKETDRCPLTAAMSSWAHFCVLFSVAVSTVDCVCCGCSVFVLLGTVHTSSSSRLLGFLVLAFGTSGIQGGGAGGEGLGGMHHGRHKLQRQRGLNVSGTAWVTVCWWWCRFRLARLCPLCKYRGRLALAVVVHGILIFHLCKCHSIPSAMRSMNSLTDFKVERGCWGFQCQAWLSRWVLTVVVVELTWG